MARGEHGRHRPQHLHRPEEEAQPGPRRRLGQLHIALHRLRPQQAQQQDKHHGQPLTGRGEDHDYRRAQPQQHAQERRGVGQRAATARPRHRRRMGSVGSHGPEAERHRHRQRQRTIQDRRIRRTGGDRATALHGDAEVIRHHRQHRAGKVLPRQGKGQRTAILHLQQGNRQPQVQPTGHRHGAGRRSRQRAHQAGARQHREHRRDEAHQQQLLAVEHARGHQEQKVPAAHRPCQLLIHLRPLTLAQHRTDHRLRQPRRLEGHHQLCLLARIQDLGAIQQDEEGRRLTAQRQKQPQPAHTAVAVEVGRQQVGTAGAGHRHQLPAAEPLHQQRVAPHLLGAAGARPAEHREPLAAHHLLRAVPVEPRATAAMGLHQEPPHELLLGHTSRD